MQNDQMAEQWNDCLDDQAMTPSGSWPAKSGEM